MCGVFGCWASPTFLYVGDEQLADIGETLAHRGPDASGIWRDPTCGLVLMHRRLAILDLSPQGHQPMVSTGGRYVMVFNGEIYNFRDLRSELAGLGSVFRGHSDTEVLLAAIEAWGVLETLARTNGMFAFALWDRKARTLILARDRLGEKPLYYGTNGKAFLFGSELKALMAWPGFGSCIDPAAMRLYLRLGYVPGPWSIFDGIKKLPPGSYVEVTEQGAGQPIHYWSLQECIAAAKAEPFNGGQFEAVDRLDALLRDSVAMRMVADVPLGAFLSGGIDSSVVVALMQAQSSRPVRTFTVGFHEAGYNEAAQAKGVASYLGTDHTEIFLDPGEALRAIPRIPELFDEPFADESQIPTYLVAKLAREYVTVALSGDGGDEVFGGYNRYFVGRGLWSRVQRMPRSFRRLGAGTLCAMADGGGWNVVNRIQAALGARWTSEQVDKAARVIGAADTDDVYWRLVSSCLAPAEVLIADGGATAESAFRASVSYKAVTDLSERMMASDLTSYLPDDILVKLDRAAMGVSLEGRIPILDHRVVEFGWRLPLHFKIRDGRGKWLLRQLLYRYVPRELVDRPKAGFSVPIGQWLRGPLRDWGEALLATERLTSQGLFNPAVVRRIWKEQMEGRNRSQQLWNLLMFQAWFERWGAACRIGGA